MATRNGERSQARTGASWTRQRRGVTGLIAAALIATGVVAGATPASAAPAFYVSTRITSIGFQSLNVAVNSTTHTGYVNDSGHNAITVFDTQTNTKTGSITNVGTIPMTVAVDEGLDRVYTSNESAQLVAIDGVTQSVVWRAAAPLRVPTGIAVDSVTHTVYAVFDDTVLIVDSAGTELARLTLPAGSSATTGVAVDSSTHKAYVAMGSAVDDSAVAIIAAGPYRVTGQIAVDRFPVGMAVDPVSHQVYVATLGGNSIQVIDQSGGPADGTVVQRVALRSAWAVAVDPTSRNLWAGSLLGTIQLIDETTANKGTVLATVPGISESGSIAFDAGLSTVYSLDLDGDRVDVILSATVPGAPTIGTAAVAGETSATVDFTAPASDGHNAISSYTVTATDSTNAGRGGQTATGTTSPITVTGLTPGDSYRFTVVATNTVGSGPSSAASNAIVTKWKTTTALGALTPAVTKPGAAVTVPYTVVTTTPGGATPTGNVTVTDGTTSCVATVAAGSCDLVLATAGVHTIHASYAGAAGFEASASGDTSHTVDGTAPDLTVPADIDATATGPSGAVVTYVASATDAVDGPITPVCTPASGSLFAAGSTTVTCTATDQAGNSTSTAFAVTVTVPDGTPTISGLTVPAVTKATTLPLSATATAPATGAEIASATAWVDTTSGAGTALTVGAGGSPVALSGDVDVSGLSDGYHVVLVRAVDDYGHVGQFYAATFLVDRTAPALAPVVTPNPVVKGKPASVSANASDSGSGLASVSCGPVPTATVGARSVSCTATDVAGNTATASAAYTVLASVPAADLRLTITSNRTTVARNGSVTVTVTVRNLGPGIAYRTRPSVQFNTARLRPTAFGRGVVTGGVVSWLAGDVPANTTRTFSVTFKALAKGSTTVTGLVVAAVPDANLGNNRASRTITIT